MSKVNITASKSLLVASIQLPSSKSISNRACIIREVIKQKTGEEIQLHNLSNAEDTNIILQALAEPKGTIDIQNAGTCLRFLTAYFAATPGIEVCLTGSPRMKQRPIHSLVNALQQLGANISYLESENCLPILIKGGKLNCGTVSIEANESSQFVSALLLITPLLAGELNIQLEGKVVSKEYILLTQKMLSKFGIKCVVNANFTLVQTETKIDPSFLREYRVEADWSSAAFFYEAALLADKADIFFPDLNLQSIQGDVVLATWMEALGIRSLQKDDGVQITNCKPQVTRKFELDFSNHPDLAPAFICATAGAAYEFTARGISSLAFKESNRIEALAKGLSKLHFRVNYDQDSLQHDGLPHGFYQNTVIETYQDHRIIMAFAMMAMHQSNITLDDVYNVSKSFPDFWKEAEKIGIKLVNIKKKTVV
jgi:3-phosphoshikimate 1-carboxyvinyltransferase